MIPASLHQSSQLIYLNVRVWSARKLDRKATEKLVKDSNATGDAARVNKYLMADSDELLRKITKIGRRAREVVDHATVPWNDAGMRLVSNLTTFSLLGDLRDVEIEFDAAVEEFCQAYPELRANALQALGDMANDEDYPPVEQIRNKFAMRTTLEPIAPAFHDDRTGLTDEQRKQLDDHYAAVHADRLKEASDAAFARLTENLERYVDRLTLTDDGKNKTFTHTMVDNLRETVAMINGLGLFDAAGLGKLAHELEVKLCRFDATELRNSIQVASAARSAATQMLASLKPSVPLSPVMSSTPSAAPSGASPCPPSPIIQPAPSPLP